MNIKHFFTTASSSKNIDLIINRIEIALILVSMFYLPITFSILTAQAVSSISIGPNGYDPPQYSITIGSTVTWINNDNHHHTVTSDNNLFDSKDIAPGGTFSYTFNNPGVFSYHCTYIRSMAGTISVG